MRSRPDIRALCVLFWLFIAALSGPTGAQTVHLSRQGAAATDPPAAAGDTLTILVRADLGNVAASGLSLYVRLSDVAFAVVDTDARARSGIQPFAQGSLFAGAAEFDNAIVPAAELPAAAGWQLIHYAAVFGAGQHGPSTGSGDIATFALRCLAPVRDSDISIYSSPVHETGLVLADGRSERDFRPSAPLTVSVIGEGVTHAPWSELKSARDTGSTPDER